MQLYNFHGSSASFRVRIALNLKEIEYEYLAVKLRYKDGEQDSAGYRELNPQGRVPVLVDGDQVISQSLAIIEYLEEVRPAPALLPADAGARARVRALANYVACEIQPLQNIGLGRYLAEELEFDRAQQRDWRRHWIAKGLSVLEVELSRSAGQYCVGDQPTMADCFLVPQVFSAVLPANSLTLSQWPNVERIFRSCLDNPAFARALPSNQPDAPTAE